MPNEVLIRVAGQLLLLQLPTMIIALVGIWYAASSEALSLRVSRCAVWGFGLLFAFALTQTALQVLALSARIDVRTEPVAEQAADQAAALMRISLWGFAAYPLFIVAIGLIARAVFLDRGDRSSG